MRGSFLSQSFTVSHRSCTIAALACISLVGTRVQYLIAMVHQFTAVHAFHSLRKRKKVVSFCTKKGDSQDHFCDVGHTVFSTNARSPVPTTMVREHDSFDVLYVRNIYCSLLRI